MSRPSRTAVKIARGILFLSADPRYAPLLPRGAAAATGRLLLAAGLHRPLHAAVYRSRAFRSLTAIIERIAPGMATAAVAEGVLMYLEAGAVAAFLATVREECAPGSRLIFDSVASAARGRVRLGPLGGAMRLALRLLGEPLRWAPRDGELAPLLARCGWRLLPPPDLRARYLVPAGIGDAPLARVDCLAAAEAVG